MTNYQHTLSHFITQTRFEDLPKAVVDRTKLIIADSIGAIVGGAAEPEIRALASRIAQGATQQSTVIGMGLKTDVAQAALLNGSAGTFLEMDEGNQFCKGHPGMHTIPAACAWAQANSVSGSEFIAAVAIGYDIAARVGIASNLRPSVHPHGTWGATGAAVAIGKLANFDQSQVESLVNISSNMCLAASRPTMLEGGTVRNMYTGISGQLGILAHSLVATGFSGESDGLQNVFGNIVSDNFSPVKMVQDIGLRWEVLRNYFKLHSCCRFNHAALDALAIIVSQAKPAVAISQIVRIDVTTYALAAELNNQSPKNTLAAKFSVPFAIATTLLNGSSEVGSFTWAAVNNHAIQALAKKVFVIEAKEMSAKLPDQRPAHVTITLTDGSALKAATQTNKGDWQDPYTVHELRQKYDSLTARLWTKSASNKVYDEIMALDEASSLSSLEQAITAADLPLKNGTGPI